MFYCVNKMCFLCLSSNKESLITYKIEPNPNNNNDNLNILLYCYPELNKITFDFPIFICRKCNRKLTLFYTFKTNGEKNYKCYLNYLESLKEKDNKKEMQNLYVQIIDFCNLGILNSENYHNNIIDNLETKKEPTADLIHDEIIKEIALNKNLNNNKQLNEENDSLISTENILEEEPTTIKNQTSQNEVQYFFIKEIQTELIIKHEICDTENKDDDINIQTEKYESDLNENETIVHENNQNMLSNDAQWPIENIPVNINQQQLINEINSNINDENSLENLLNSQQQDSKCSETFKDLNELENHLNIHCNIALFKCNICLQTFISNEFLQIHLSTHSEDKAQICEICLKIFSQKQHLISHYQIHMENKPYQCTICSKSFRHKSTLKRHTKMHFENELVSCSICLKKFPNKSSLKAHFRIHSNEKPYKCSVCSKRFNDKSNFIRHCQIHTGNKPYKCTFCPKSFYQKFSAIDHFRTHTGDRPYKCTVCSKSFSFNGSFRRHCQIHNKQKKS